MTVKRKFIKEHAEIKNCFHKKPFCFVKFTLTRDDLDFKRFILTEEYNWFARKILSVLLILPSWFVLGLTEGFPGAWKQTISEFKEWWHNQNKCELYFYDRVLIDKFAREIEIVRYNLIKEYWDEYNK